MAHSSSAYMQPHAKYLASRLAELSGPLRNWQDIQSAQQLLLKPLASFTSTAPVTGFQVYLELNLPRNLVDLLESLLTPALDPHNVKVRHEALILYSAALEALTRVATDGAAAEAKEHLAKPLLDDLLREGTDGAPGTKHAEISYVPVFAVNIVGFSATGSQGQDTHAYTPLIFITVWSHS